VPTRAEASDVATAIYDGADAVMLSAESASGRYPLEAVRIMDSIITQTEGDSDYRLASTAMEADAAALASDGIGAAVRSVTELLPVAAVVAYTSSGYSALRMARERPRAPIIGMTPRLEIARRLALAWGVYPVLCEEVGDVLQMSTWACQTARREGIAGTGTTIVITAGVPFGTPGTTNLLRIAQID
jgi:pyruvate kinase